SLHDALPIWRQIVVAAAMGTLEVAPDACQGQGPISDAVDAVLCLPPSSPRDVRPRCARVDHRPAEQIARVGGIGRRDLSGTAEEQPKPGAAWAEPRRGSERQVDLEAARQKEHAVDRVAAREVE